MAAHTPRTLGTSSFRLTGSQLACGSARDAVRQFRAESDAVALEKPSLIERLTVHAATQVAKEGPPSFQIRLPANPLSSSPRRSCPKVLRSVRKVTRPARCADGDTLEESGAFSDSTASLSSTSSCTDSDSELEASSDEQKNCNLPGFFVEKVEAWYRAVDTKGAGKVSQLEFRMALQEHVELQLLVCRATGITWSEQSRNRYMRRNAIGLLGLSIEERSAVIVEERKRMKAIIDQLEWGEDRKLDCKGFLAVFRKSGMLLE